ncbi:MAG: RNA polymerase factor sigma-54 [Phycisphaerae bacterium]|nr:RNA polymerase factor sigma-54 [Phycisphaerae bacterium]
MKFELSQTPQARLGQQLKIAPRVLQSVEILQMPIAAMEQRIAAELESNVALEQVEPEGERTEEQDDLPKRRKTRSKASEAEGERLSSADRMRSRMGDDDDAAKYREAARREGEFDPRVAAVEGAAASSGGLEQALLDQWVLCEAPKPIIAAGKVLIANIDARGFLARPIDVIAGEAATETFAPSAELLQQALQRLQEFLEPAGLAASDLPESLRLQLNAHERTESHAPNDTRFADARELVSHHLPDLERARVAAIRQQRGWSAERLEAALACLRRCDPAPGRTLASEPAPLLRPDVIIDHDPATDQFSARLASGLVPNLRVSEEYLRLAKDRRTDAATRTMLKDGIRRARWFIDAVEQRGATLLRVVQEVIARQREWIEVGGATLKPMPMIEVARSLRLHVSTISRTVAGKWVAAPRGTFELRRAFTGGTETETGSDISWTAVRGVVGEIIAAEDKAHPLSDDAVVSALKERGIPLARRTVVKYRDQLGIPTARLRRREQS